MTVLLVSIIGMMLGLLASGMWIGVAAAIVGIFILWNKTGFAPMMLVVGWTTWNATTSFTLAAIPLFIFMGFMLMESGLTARVYSGIEAITDRLPGGLLHTNIVVAALFAATSGSSTAAAATIGSVSLPEMEKRGYPFGISLGSVGAGALLAPLIPPSIIMILYCEAAQQSIGQEFMAGILPGLLLAGLFSAYIGIAFALTRIKGATGEQNVPWRNSLARLTRIWPILLLIVLVLGSIYAGIATPTEAAGMGAVGSIFVAALFRGLNWKVIKDCTTGTLKITAQIMFIFVGIQIMSNAISIAGVVEFVTKTSLTLPVPPLVILLVVCAVFLVTGLFIEGIPMMLLIVPIVFPVISRLGFDLIWFGILVVLLCNVGNLTPPVGATLFVLQALRPERPIMDIYRGLVPFIVVLLIEIAILIAFPQIALFLPSAMIGK